jgi:hypothetical protein
MHKPPHRAQPNYWPLGTALLGFHASMLSFCVLSLSFYVSPLPVFVDLLAPVPLHPRCRDGCGLLVCRPARAGAPPSSALGWAWLLGSSTSNAAIVVALAAAVVVLTLLAFVDERAPPPIPVLVARAPPHLSYIPLSATTETPNGRCTT